MTAIHTELSAYDNAIWNRLPAHCREALRRYVDDGTPPGHFLTALLSNDLNSTFARADDTNRPAIYDYLLWLYNWSPAGCHGSPENFENWIRNGGSEEWRRAEEWARQIREERSKANV